MQVELVAFEVKCKKHKMLVPHTRKRVSNEQSAACSFTELYEDYDALKHTLHSTENLFHD